MKKLLMLLVPLLALPMNAQAEWTPLVTSTLFDGIRTDLLTTVAGIVSCLLIVVGLGILYKVFR